MISVDLRSLVSRFNPTCRQALEQAVGYTLSRGQYNVEVEHLLLKLLDRQKSDVVALMRLFEIDEGKLSEDLTRVVDRFKGGATRTPGLSPNLITLGREAWLIGSLRFGARSVRSGHLLAALFADDALAPMAREASRQFASLTADQVTAGLSRIAGQTEEAESAEAGPGGGGAPQGMPGAPAGGALERFTTDLTAEARAGRIDPVIGRDAEVRQMIDILTRRRQNNPILTGEAGVGKTAVVEGFALRVASGDVPGMLENAEIRALDLGLLQAGASAKGEFEERLKGVIEEVKASPKFMITFIDEAHTLIGAGGQAGQNDAANLLKPALARGELRTIAATTWAEYKKYFERDAALARRFQVVKIDEPDEPRAIRMIRGVAGKLEGHHGTRVLDEAVEEAVRLSSRYIQGRQLPDKAVSVLDTACARVAMSQGATPATVEDLARTTELLDVEIAALDREAAAGGGHETRLAELRAERDRVAADLETAKARWGREKEVIARIRTLREGLEAGAAGAPHETPPEGEAAPAPLADPDAARAELARETGALAELQGEAPLVHPFVDAQAVASVVSAWTGVPLGRIVSSEMETIRSLADHLRERVIGQDHALHAIAEAVRAARAGLTDPRKPIGVFMLCGTSGVGKTETAMALADILYGGEQNLTVINMSEFKEEHKVSLLTGSPPGYVGYGEGGVLTEAVRRRPYGVVLLDEVEKAHSGVQDVFYQVFDKGMLKDGEGRDIDFKNTLILLTSNAGTRTIEKLSADPETMPDVEGLAEALRPELLEFFKPAFIGRTTLIPYMPLSPETLRLITELQLGRLGKRIRGHYGAEFVHAPELVETIAQRCTAAETGARNILHIIEQTVMPRLAGGLLEALGEGRRVSRVSVGVDAEGAITYEIA